MIGIPGPTNRTVLPAFERLGFGIYFVLRASDLAPHTPGSWQDPTRSWPSGKICLSRARGGYKVGQAEFL